MTDEELYEHNKWSAYPPQIGPGGQSCGKISCGVTLYNSVLDVSISVNTNSSQLANKDDAFDMLDRYVSMLRHRGKL